MGEFGFWGRSFLASTKRIGMLSVMGLSAIRPCHRRDQTSGVVLPAVSTALVALAGLRSVVAGGEITLMVRGAFGTAAQERMTACANRS